MTLVEYLRQEDLLNVGEKHLYDLEDEDVKSSYEQLRQTAEPETIRRDNQSNSDIISEVKQHTSQYENPLVVVEGAGRHIWGAVPELERNGFGYISTTAERLNPENVQENEVLVDSRSEALENIERQMERDLGVVKSMGYEGLEEFLSDRESGNNTVIGVEETGLHGMYTGDTTQEIYDSLTALADTQEYDSILYIGEDLNTESIQSGIEDGRTSLPRDQFLSTAHQSGINIRVGRFG
jgi:hypothetical protein